MSGTALNLLVGLALLVGILGLIVPVLPGTILIVVALVLWAVLTGGSTAWIIASIALAVVAAGQVLKLLIPGRAMQSAGVPTRTLVVGSLAGLVGFFVVPVVGMLIGFVGGVYLAEHVRLRSWPEARASTIAAMKATGVSMLIELLAAVLAATVWAVGLTQV